MLVTLLQEVQMKSTQLFRVAGWSAYLSVAAMFATAAVVMTMPTLTGLMARLENIATSVFALAMVPLALALNRLYRSHLPALIVAATSLGVLAMLTAAGTKLLVLIGALSSEGVADFLDDLTFLLIGIWLVVVGYAGWRAQTPAAGLAVLAGLGQILGTAGFLISEPPPVWAFLGGALALVGYPLWAIAMGRSLRRDAVDKSLPPARAAA
jgi:hypothetical protein